MRGAHLMWTMLIAAVQRLVRAKAVVRLTCLTVLAGAYTGASPSAQMLTKPATVDAEISSSDFQRFGYVLEPLEARPSREEVRFSRSGSIVVLRIVNGDFCLNEVCLTYVISDCERPVCPHTSGMARNRYEIWNTQSGWLGVAVVFPTGSNIQPTFLVNKRLVSAFHGIQ